MKHIIGILLLFLVVNEANAQFFQTGQDPSHIQWRQINTDHFQVIYPEEFDKEAQRLSYVLSKAYEYGSRTMNFNPRKISVVLHTRTINSNGLVAWAPKRMELFTTPPQQIYAQDWLEQLALHEFRHFVQMDKIQSELPFLLKLILGEQATAIVTGTYLPLWFLEGDAVVTETALSHSGRGRMASFNMEYRAQLTQRGKYSLDKAYLGSYKDFVPDYYKLGYLLVGKGREEYGPQLWSDVIDKVGNQPLSIRPVNAVLKKETGMNTKQLYNQIFNDLSLGWKQDLNAEAKSSSPIVSPLKKNYTSYLYPEYYQDSLIVAYRTSIDDIGRFVMISPGGSEKIIYTPGSILDESVSMKNQLIIWAEDRADIRWTHADRSVILIYNMATKRKQEFRLKNKLFSPAISPDLKSFAAVEVDPQNNFFLTVFNLNTGDIMQRYNTRDNAYFINPCWDEKGEKLYFVSLTAKGKCLSSLDIQTKEIQSITPYTFGDIKNPVFINHQLIFSADFSGTDHLYSMDLGTHQVLRIYKADFGVDYPSATNSKNEILFSNYSARGYQLSVLNLADKSRLTEIASISLQSNPLADKLGAQEKGIPDLTNRDSIQYHSKKYSKLGHLFNFHSWAPAYVDINSYEIRPGVTFFSQNTLGTAETQIGYDYNVADHTGKYRLAFNYFGLFPELNTDLSYGNGVSHYYQVNNTTDQFNHVIKSDTTVQSFGWHEWTADVDMRIPLNLSKGKYSAGLFPEIKYTFNQSTPNASAPESFNPEDYHALTYRLYYYHIIHQSSQNIIPKWGQQFDLIFRHTPFVGTDLGNLSGIQSVLYFPGLSRNDGFKIYQGYQQKNFAQLSSFSNFVRFPRGYQSMENNKLYSFAADYMTPLSYPDLSLGKLVYFKRIKSSLFYDYAFLSVPIVDKNHVIVPNQYQMTMNSLGLELTSDLHVLRFFAPVEMGFRTIYRPEFQDFQFNLLLSVDFNGF
ncbi:MAG TPA: hypothetical protein DCL77_03070 [Prolixibacteraceae bacterium]|jgi:hypothetical protein|nr:hypothetical protein [Prolixibacteraceae bacterium]